MDIMVAAQILRVVGLVWIIQGGRRLFDLKGRSRKKTNDWSYIIVLVDNNSLRLLSQHFLRIPSLVSASLKKRNTQMKMIKRGENTRALVGPACETPRNSK
jgi:hypothetical protein